MKRLAAVAAVALVAGLAVAGRLLVVTAPVIQPDAIVSLASHEWERLPEAARLAARSPAASVLLTQPPAVTLRNCHDCAHRVDRLAHLGVSRSARKTSNIISTLNIR